MELTPGDAGLLIYDSNLCRIVVHKVEEKIIHFRYEEGEKNRPIEVDPEFDNCFRMSSDFAKKSFKPDWMI